MEEISLLITGNENVHSGSPRRRHLRSPVRAREEDGSPDDDRDRHHPLSALLATKKILRYTKHNRRFYRLLVCITVLLSVTMTQYRTINLFLRGDVAQGTTSPLKQTPDAIKNEDVENKNVFRRPSVSSPIKHIADTINEAADSINEDADSIIEDFEDKNTFRLSSATMQNCSDFDPFAICPFRITEGRHLTSPPPPVDLTCSCWNATEECCRRNIKYSHKMGTMLTRELFAKVATKWRGFISHSFFPPIYHGQIGQRSPVDLDKYFHGSPDYRQVILVRNWYEALVSGYLYHKGGAECWLDEFGKRRPDSMANHLKGLTSSSHLKKSLKVAHILSSLPPVEGRSLCQYLIDESEEVGMRAYIEVVIRYKYSQYISVFKAVQEREDPLHRRTLFVCYEDLNDKEHRTVTMRRIMDWFFPGGVPPNLLQKLPPTETGGQEEYKGGHATSQHPELRARLRELVGKMDREVFHGDIKRYSDLFGCG